MRWGSRVRRATRWVLRQIDPPLACLLVVFQKAGGQHCCSSGSAFSQVQHQEFLVRHEFPKKSPAPAQTPSQQRLESTHKLCHLRSFSEFSGSCRHFARLASRYWNSPTNGRWSEQDDRVESELRRAGSWRNARILAFRRDRNSANPARMARECSAARSLDHGHRNG